MARWHILKTVGAGHACDKITKIMGSQMNPDAFVFISVYWRILLWIKLWRGWPTPAILGIPVLTWQHYLIHHYRSLLSEIFVKY